MKKKFLFAVTLAAVALASCNNDNGQVLSQTKPEYITVSTSIDNLTRVSTTGNASKFDEGDMPGPALPMRWHSPTLQ